jgi:phenylacetate-CoA ligase
MTLDEHGDKKYWDEERETRDPKQREVLILEQLQKQLEYVYAQLPFYTRLYDEHGVKPSDVKSLEDFTTKIPVVTKKMLIADQAEHPPFGSYAGPIADDDVARIQGSTGTSGTPTFYRVSKKDWNRAADLQAMAYWSAGMRPWDVFQIAFPFSLFFGGWGVLQGAEKLGATCFPIGVVDSERQIELMYKLGSTVFTATPSYGMHLMSVAEKMGKDLRDGPVKRLLIGGEAGGCVPGTRDALRAGWGAMTHDSGTTSEMYPFGSNIENAAGEGVHCIIDEVYTEIVDRDDSSVPVPYGTRGAIVYTHLWRESQPMIRFWAGDESVMEPGPTSCGRTYPRLPLGVIGRLDDMLVIRGANIYPSTVETGLRSVHGLGPEFLITVQKSGAMDEMSVQVEYGAELAKGFAAAEDSAKRQKLAELRKEAEAQLKRITNIRVPVEIIEPGTLPESVFKAQRVRDLREKA